MKKIKSFTSFITNEDIQFDKTSTISNDYLNNIPIRYISKMTNEFRKKYLYTDNKNYYSASINVKKDPSNNKSINEKYFSNAILKVSEKLLGLVLYNHLKYDQSLLVSNLHFAYYKKQDVKSSDVLWIKANKNGNIHIQKLIKLYVDDPKNGIFYGFSTSKKIVNSSKISAAAAMALKKFKNYVINVLKDDINNYNYNFETIKSKSGKIIKSLNAGIRSENKHVYLAKLKFWKKNQK
jgi:hypothetical protein